MRSLAIRPIPVTERNRASLAILNWQNIYSPDSRAQARKQVEGERSRIQASPFDDGVPPLPLGDERGDLSLRHCPPYSRANRSRH